MKFALRRDGESAASLGLWWKEVVLMDESGGPPTSWCTPVLELRASHACTNHAVLSGEWAKLYKRFVEAATA